MTAADGSIGSMVKVVDHGPANARWNLVVLGDGYRASELAKYHSDVDAFINDIRTTPPYDELWCGVNVYRIDVTSTDSGADEPTDCGGPGTTPRTYYDATFCSDWGGIKLERLLTIGDARAQADAVARLPQTRQVLVIVNSAKYGGSGGQVAVCSTHTQASAIAIHEIGHSAYGLADEYEDGGTAAGAEPMEPNVTLDANRATNKWRDLVLATTPMPSSCNPGCVGCVPPATPPPAGRVGAYEGARYMRCAMYRPLPNCYMRDYSPFCPVCSRVIRQTITPFLPPELISLTTPSIAFTDIPEGVGGGGITTYRAIAFEVQTCRRLTFRITAGPTGGFGTPFGLVDQVTAGEYTSIDTARLWLSYTSTVAGSTSTGTVTVRCDETGQTWNINIVANTVPRPRTEVALVLDHSGSMSEDSGDGTIKVQKLREAAGIFVDAMLSGDGISVVRFDDTAQRLMNVTDVGPLGTGTGRTTAIGHIQSPALDPAGNTSIGAGVVAGKQALDDGQAAASLPYSVMAMVVLTDGVENTPPMLASVGSSISSRTFAIGLGMPYNISVAALNTLTQGNDGYLLVTGTLSTDQRTRLTKYFLQVLAGITNANIVLDPSGWLPWGAEHDVPFQLSDTDYAFDVYGLTPYPQLLNIQLEAPNGKRYRAADLVGIGTAQHLARNGVVLSRVALPADPGDPSGTHGGTWHAILELARDGARWDDRRLRLAADQAGHLPYDLLVHCYSNLVFSARATQTGWEPGIIVTLTATLTEYDVPVGSRATVWCDLTGPNAGKSMVPMTLQADGSFEGSFVASQVGLYTGRVRAHGETFRGEPFTREQTLTAVTRPGGSTEPGAGEDPLRELICCIARSIPPDREVWKRLSALGIDVGHLRECLERLCASPGDSKQPEPRQRTAGVSADALVDLLRQHLK